MCLRQCEKAAELEAKLSGRSEAEAAARLPCLARLLKSAAGGARAAQACAWEAKKTSKRSRLGGVRQRQAKKNLHGSADPLAGSPGVGGSSSPLPLWTRVDDFA